VVGPGESKLERLRAKLAPGAVARSPGNNNNNRRGAGPKADRETLFEANAGVDLAAHQFYEGKDDTYARGSGRYSDTYGYGYASIENIYTGTKIDRQESFLIAETLKYLYLLLSYTNKPHASYRAIVPGTEPDDGEPSLLEKHMSFDDWVFNTEAHPIRARPYTMPATKLPDGGDPLPEPFHVDEGYYSRSIGLLELMGQQNKL
jgi:hypothetical protein